MSLLNGHWIIQVSSFDPVATLISVCAYIFYSCIHNNIYKIYAVEISFLRTSLLQSYTHDNSVVIVLHLIIDLLE